ncbi:aspartate aminotransferase [Burkholderia stagnalis]|uniref:aminotransferase class I/II-fold pyridoxal phosphate-dependent enzyme n=1 Tax=Burkholderia stagnalis TaxID=1503054 RepID=UPI00075FFDE7|nr:aminotransferase class I/II-fold pyridoxal phosphate-dependent enzyme [Burkholderia stagnalis]KWK49995.1 aspartate aminotransferase [Burkholderia stagnalis]KWK57776.1 aspartate aminotransferase [Burkholderia stagnalis]
MADIDFLSERITRIKPSPSMAAKALVDKLRAEGRDIIDFTIGEPDLPTPAHVIDAAVAAMHRGETKYTSVTGTPLLRKTIADKLARDNGLDFAPENIMVGSGGKHIIFHALSVTLNPGDEVVIHAPYWVSYPDMVVVNDGVPVIVTGSEVEGFKLTPDALEAAITPRTKWVILNTPNNPTGAVYSEAELKALGAVLERHPHVWLMSDEIYEHFVYNDVKHVSPVAAMPALRERSLIVNGASKGYSMTGWRIGYGAGPKPLINAMAKLVTQTTTCPTSISQAAAVAAFGGSQEAPHQAALEYASRGKLMAARLREARGIDAKDPTGAFYLYPSVAGLIGRTTPNGDTLESDTDVVKYLTEEAGVATLDGSSYGLAPYLRLSFATSEQAIEEGCRRIVEACAKLN